MIHPFTAQELKQSGINVAMHHAELKHEGWNEEALLHMKGFLRTRITPFLCEDVRLYAEENGMQKAPSARAWGGVILQAKKAGLIQHFGYTQVKNPRAHRANASLWTAV
jgi:hypothetical protein